MRRTRTIAVGWLATGLLGGFLVAADKPPAVKAAATPPPDSEEPHYPPKLQTNLFDVPWRHAELKPQHAVIAALVGKWTAGVHLFAGPYVREMDSQGTAEGKLLMGGLFVQVAQSGKRMKQSFEGVMTYGYDEATGRYTGSWIDNTSTAIIPYVGTYDATKKQLTMSAHFSDQKSRRLTISRVVTTFVDANNWTYEEFVSHAKDEPDTPVVSISFKRS